MDVTVTVAIIGLIEALGVALIAALVSRAEKSTAEYRKEAEERESARAERDACLYDLIFALANGTEVLLHQAHGDKVNGDVDEALSSIKKAKGECNRVFNRQAARI